MRKRNLFSKIVAGIGALAMVATMMPTMATTALAADTSFDITVATLDNWYAKVITEDEYKDGVDVSTINGYNDSDYAGYDFGDIGKTGTIIGKYSDTAAGTDWDVTTDGDTLYLLLEPSVYYEWPDGAALISVDMGAGSWEGTSNNRYPYTETAFQPIKNKADNRGGDGFSYLVALPVDQFSDGTTNVTFSFSEVKPVVLTVRVDVGSGSEAIMVSGAPSVRHSVANGGELVFNMWWESDYVDGTLATRTNGIVINQKGRPGDVYYISTSGDVITTGELVTANERRISITADKVNSSGKMSIAINGADYAKHALTSQAIKNGSTWDTETYIQFGSDAPQVLHPKADAAKTATKGFTYSNNSPIPDGQTTFSIWWDELFALYFHGLDTQASATATARYTSTTDNWNAALTTRDASTAYRYFTKNANGERELKISIGAELSDGYVWFVNDPIKTEDLSVANMYEFKYVFRDENGKRFDTTEDAENSYSSDELRNKTGKWTENDELKFTIKFDPIYQPASNFKVWIKGKDGVAQDITNKKDENGVYTVKLGGDFDYEVWATGIEKVKTRKVVNQPEADAVYRKHPEVYSAWPATNATQVFGGFGFYSQEGNEFKNWMSGEGGGCNVAEPRYSLYLAAHEEDTDYIDVFPFAAPRAVATTDADYLGHDFPIGTYKFRIRFNNDWVNNGAHGAFNDIVIDDRYAKGADFKVTIDGVEAKEDADGLYTLDVTEGTDPIVIKVEGVTRAYRVYAPNVAGYNIEPNFEIDRDANNNFISSVPEGELYRFKLNLAEGTDKGPDFKVMLVARADDEDNKNNFVPTEIKEDAEGYYSFTVNNDTEIVIYGLTGTGFSDIGTRSAEEQEAINYLRDKGVITGYDDGSFRPGNNLTRAEFVTMLYRLNEGTAGTASFSDTAGNWAASEIGWAATEGIVNGYPDGTFRPGASISRAEVSQIMWKLNGKGGANMIADFSDVNQGAWYAPAVNWNFEKGIIKGYGDGRFGTNDPIERAHMALILYRAR